MTSFRTTTWGDGSPDEKRKSRLLAYFWAAGSLISITLFFLQPHFFESTPRFVFLLAVLLLCILFALLQLGFPQVLIAHGMVGTAWVCLMLGTYYTGGIHSMLLPWIGLMAISANLLTNYRNSLAWFAAGFVSIIAFAVVESVSHEIVFSAAIVKPVAAAVGLSLVLFVFTNGINKNKRRLLAILKERNGELLVQKTEINHINARLKRKVDEVADRNQKMERYWNVLIEVAKSDCIDKGILEVALGHIANVTRETLGVSRVSVWTFHRDGRGERIDCVVIFDLRNDSPMVPRSIWSSQNVRYFEAIKSEKIIAADRASKHLDTRDFNESYLAPLKIESMLDTPFFIDGQLAGVLCVEQQRETRVWSHEDILFTISMTKMISLAYRAVTRRVHQENLRRLSKEIKEQNENLEERVKKRTEELVEKNRQLTEFAFINAHIVRGPLCRVLGLINLLRYPHLNADPDINARLQESAGELETVVNKMTKALSEGLPVDRKKF